MNRHASAIMFRSDAVGSAPCLIPKTELKLSKCLCGMHFGLNEFVSTSIHFEARVCFQHDKTTLYAV